MTMPNALTAVLRLALALCASCSIALGSAWAQEPGGQAGSQKPGSEAAAGNAAGADAQATTAAPEAPEEETSPFDYEATEQISEDLSVSFPVDI